MCEDVLFADVCAVLHKLSDPFVTPVKKLNYFSRYLEKIEHESPVDLFPLLRLLTPSLDRRRPPSQLRQHLLARVYAQVFALPPAAAARLRLYKDPAAATPEAGTSVRVGDFGSFVIATLKRRIGTRSPTVTVRELNSRLDRVCLATAFPEKIVVLHELFPLLTVHEHKWFVRILMKDVKLGGLTGERLLTVLHPGARKLINQCSDLQSTLEAIEEQSKVDVRSDESHGVAKARPEHADEIDGGEGMQPSVKDQDSSRLLFRPLRPMLAHPIRPEAADIQLELFSSGGTATSERRDILRAASDPHLYLIERKYDGERMFAHIDLTRNPVIEGDVPEEEIVREAAAAESVASCVRLFSRRGRDITKQYGGTELASIPHYHTLDGVTTPQASVEKLEEPEECEQPREVPGQENPLKCSQTAVLDGLRIMLARALRGNQAILDGELLAWDDERGTFLPFGTNKSVAVSETTSCHLSYVIFDILFYRNAEGTAYNLLSMQLKDRKKLLERVLKPVGSRIMLASYVEATEANQVIDAFNVAVQKRHEGIVVKRATSFYHLHLRRGGWYKIKPRAGCLSDTLDLIVIGAFFAETSRRREHTSTHAIDHCSHFLLGVLEGRGGPAATRVRSFCRIGSGFSLTDLVQMRDFVRPYCRRLPPLDAGKPAEKINVPPWLVDCRLNASTRVDVTWPPSRSFVMEVSAAEVIPSVEFDLGFTLRFATATRPFRRDKDWFEAMSEADLQAFFQTCEERGGIRITSSVIPVGSKDPAVKHPLNSLVEGEASDEETEEEGDDDMSKTGDVAFDDWRTPGRRPNNGTAGDSSLETEPSNFTSPSLLSTSYQRSPADKYSVPFSLLASARSGHKLRRSSSRPWRPVPIKANSFDISIPPVELQGLVQGMTAHAPILPSTVLRGQCVWIVEGGDEEGDGAQDRREEQRTHLDIRPTKTALEWLVTAMGGTVAPALSPGVTHVIASRHTFRTEAAIGALSETMSITQGGKGGKGSLSRWRRNVAQAVMPPVLHYNWLLDCARLNTLAAVRPAHVLHGTPELTRKFAEQYDRYGDAYFELANSPRSLLPIIETAIAHGQDETVDAHTSSAQQRKDSSSELCSLQEERQEFVGGSTQDSSLLPDDVQLTGFRTAILQVSDPSELSCMVLYVPPEDAVWEPPSALKVLQPASVRDLHLTTSPHQDLGPPGSSAALQRPYSIRTREMQKATRAALIARCCARGMRLTLHVEDATHLLTASSTVFSADSSTASHVTEAEKNVRLTDYVRETFECINMSTEDPPPEKTLMEVRMLEPGDTRYDGIEQQTSHADQRQVVLTMHSAVTLFGTVYSESRRVFPVFPVSKEETQAKPQREMAGRKQQLKHGRLVKFHEGKDMNDRMAVFKRQQNKYEVLSVFLLLLQMTERTSVWLDVAGMLCRRDYAPPI